MRRYALYAAWVAVFAGSLYLIFTGPVQSAVAIQREPAEIRAVASLIITLYWAFGITMLAYVTNSSIRKRL